MYTKSIAKFLSHDFTTEKLGSDIFLLLWSLETLTAASSISFLQAIERNVK